MHQFKSAINKQNGQGLSYSACEAIKQRAKEDDKRSEHFTIGNAYWFQFWAHQGLDSSGDGNFRVNRYNGLQDGEGIYPTRRDDIILNRDGTFRLSVEGGLPLLTFEGNDGTDEKTAVEVAPDNHRVNENPVLSAFHLLAIKCHNKRMQEHGDFELAQSETIALMNIVSLNESLILCGMDEKEFFDHIVVKDFHLATEFNFAVARWAHPMMAETVNGRPLFEPMRSQDVNLIAMFDGSEMARDLNFGTSTAMQNMHHLPGDNPSILDRTFARHHELDLPCWQDLCFVYEAELENTPSAKCCELGAPIFAGMLFEAEKFDGRPGPVLSRALADGLAGSLMWGKSFAQGLWLPLWRGAPRSTINIIDYALS